MKKGYFLGLALWFFRTRDGAKADGQDNCEPGFCLTASSDSLLSFTNTHLEKNLDRFH
jgi:hypothetical protein